MRSVEADRLHRLSKYCHTLKSRTKDLSSSGKIRTKGMVSVIFLTWERDSYLETTIDSFLKFHKTVEPTMNVQMISIDNGSRNENVHKILSKYSWDISIRNKTNIGISAALNQVFRTSTGEFIMSLEDDWQTIATRPMLAPSVRILNEYPDICGVRLKENVQNCIHRRIEKNSKRVELELDKNLMNKLNLSGRGKHYRRKWYDERKTSLADRFYTWSIAPKTASVYCNSCFLYRGEVFDKIQPIRNEYSYSNKVGRYYNSAVLVDEPKMIHRGEIRQGGSWHE